MDEDQMITLDDWVDNHTARYPNCAVDSESHVWDCLCDHCMVSTVRACEGSRGGSAMLPEMVNPLLSADDRRAIWAALEEVIDEEPG